jgi:hypothetical protein
MFVITENIMKRPVFAAVAVAVAGAVAVAVINS